MAVFPFENLSVHEGNEMFCKAFTLDLLTELSKFKQFRIISPQTLKNLTSASEEFGQLGADYHIQGVFLGKGDAFQVTAELVNSKTFVTTWSEKFEGDRATFLDAQNHLLREVVSTLQQQLNFDLLSQLKHKNEVEIKAYEYWLNGLNEVKKGSLEHDLYARKHFKRAIDIDPNYSLAYSGMSLTYFNEWSCQLWDQWELSQNGAFTWAQKAIEIDDQNYMAAMILGRVFMYERAFETAEFYLRKSLNLNQNDTDSLIQIASCFTYLGLANEAISLYEKALKQNPANHESYYHVGALIYFELGQYAQAARLAERIHKHLWVDAPAIFSAIYFKLGDHSKMEENWSRYMVNYRSIINKGREATNAEAVDWQIKVSPYKEKTNLLDFWSFKADQTVHLPIATPTDAVVNLSNVFRKAEELWEMGYQGASVMVSEVKGYHDICKLLQQPHQPIHSGELMGIVLESADTPLLDEQSKRAYQKQINALQEEIQLAEDMGDFEQASQYQQQYEALVDHLSSSLGLQRKSRAASDPVEKARSAVTWRIRNAISRIEKAHPALGKHLSNNIQTGTLCMYRPEGDMKWVLA